MKAPCVKAIGLTIAVLAILAQSPVVAEEQDLDRRIRDLEFKLDVLLLEYTVRHPDVRVVQSRLEDLYAKRRQRGELKPKTPPEVPAPLDQPPEKVVAVVDAQVSKLADQPVPSAIARKRRELQYVQTYEELCLFPGVLACFDFDGKSPLASEIGKITGEFYRSSSEEIGAKLYRGKESRGKNSVRMDFRSKDGANHGAFFFHLDAFGQGDLMTVQWRQWFSPEITTRFEPDRGLVFPGVGGDGAKQLVISEIGDSQGCSFGELVTGNSRWLGVVRMYHGCGLWFAPTASVTFPNGTRDLDVQPGGDNACRYRYFFYKSDSKPFSYLYPTEPENLLDIRALSGVVHPERYHGCLGWKENQWITFRYEVRIAFCKEEWRGDRVPAGCVGKEGRVRYWIKYVDERKPWLVIDHPLPIRWNEAHTERYGRFMFTPYNTGEKPLPDKPPGFTLYDDIVVARNTESLPWQAD
jgi:hypothetical protein